MSAGPSAGVSDKYWCNPSLEPRSKTEARAHHARCTLRRSLSSRRPQRREFRWHPRSRELFWACLICSGRRRGTLTARAPDLVDGKVAFAWFPLLKNRRQFLRPSKKGQHYTSCVDHSLACASAVCRLFIRV